MIGFFVDVLDVDSRSVNKKWNFVMTALTVEIFFVGMTGMVTGNDKYGVVEPGFSGSSLEKFLQRDVGISNGVLHCFWRSW